MWWIIESWNRIFIFMRLERIVDFIDMWIIKFWEDQSDIKRYICYNWYEW